MIDSYAHDGLVIMFHELVPSTSKERIKSRKSFHSSTSIENFVEQFHTLFAEFLSSENALDFSALVKYFKLLHECLVFREMRFYTLSVFKHHMKIHMCELRASEGLRNIINCFILRQNFQNFWSHFFESHVFEEFQILAAMSFFQKR